MPRKRDVDLRLKETQEKVERLKDEQRLRAIKERIKSRTPRRRTRRG